MTSIGGEKGVVTSSTRGKPTMSRVVPKIHATEPVFLSSHHAQPRAERYIGLKGEVFHDSMSLSISSYSITSN